MSKYYQYEMVSAAPTFALVKEELKSYFEAGIVDDLLFPVWTGHCIQDLSRAVLPIKETVLFIDDFECRLPPNFKAVREAWMCTQTCPQTIRLPGAYYTQTTSLLNPKPLECGEKCDPCNPLTTQLIYKTNTDITFTTPVTYLLKPGNNGVRQYCSTDCRNFSSNAPDTFDIRGNKFVVSFREADVYLIYYANEYDEAGTVLIPQNRKIQKYIEAYLKYKIFEQLWNQVTDETFNQIERKYQVYKQACDEAKTIAEIENRKQTTEQKIAAMLKDQNRLNIYRRL